MRNFVRWYLFVLATLLFVNIILPRLNQQPAMRAAGKMFLKKAGIFPIARDVFRTLTASPRQVPEEMRPSWDPLPVAVCPLGWWDILKGRASTPAPDPGGEPQPLPPPRRIHPKHQRGYAQPGARFSRMAA